MIHEGEIVLFRFPQTNHTTGKLRPALVLRKLPGRYEDWMICMISCQLFQQIKGLDEIINIEDMDFKNSGLKVISLVRASRLAVVSKSFLLGAIGEISNERLARIKASIAEWIKG